MGSLIKMRCCSGENYFIIMTKAQSLANCSPHDTPPLLKAEARPEYEAIFICLLHCPWWNVMRIWSKIIALSLPWHSLWYFFVIRRKLQRRSEIGCVNLGGAWGRKISSEFNLRSENYLLEAMSRHATYKFLCETQSSLNSIDYQLSPPFSLRSMKPRSISFNTENVDHNYNRANRQTS